MRAAIFSEYGGPEVLRVSEVDTPRAGAGQVRVRVRAAGVQPYDLAVRAGWTPPGYTRPLPRIPGNEFAGVVDEVGADAAGRAAGLAGSGPRSVVTRLDGAGLPGRPASEASATTTAAGLADGVSA